MTDFKYMHNVEKCIEWITSRMMTFDNGYNGIYERIRIDLNIRTNWSRPDCNAEFARVLYLYRQLTNNCGYDDISNNITEWLLRVQDKNPLSVWYGSFPFYLVDGWLEDGPVGNTVYQNDNGKVLIVLTQLYEQTQNRKYLDSAIALADYWIGVQQKDGTFVRLDGRTTPFGAGPCFILWLAAGLLLLYKSTGTEKYRRAARKALNFAAGNLLESGRMKTSYELVKVEDWRPVSSEAAIALYAFSIAYRVEAEDRYLGIIDRIGRFILSLQHSGGGILNCDDSCTDASLQNNKMLCDLVYTQGFALIGLIEAYKATGDARYHASAVRLADFLAAIQCRNESPLWDGAWRGSYNVETQKWDGRANQNNSIDEGGKFSVYTGWCSTNIMYGMLMLDKYKAGGMTE